MVTLFTWKQFNGNKEIWLVWSFLYSHWHSTGSSTSLCTTLNILSVFVMYSCIISVDVLLVLMYYLFCDVHRKTNKIDVRQGNEILYTRACSFILASTQWRMALYFKLYFIYSMLLQCFADVGESFAVVYMWLLNTVYYFITLNVSFINVDIQFF